MTLGKALAIRAQNHRHMGILWQWRAQRPKDIDLAWGVVDVVVAADDVSNVHVEIVDHHAEVISRHPVAPQQHEIVQLAVCHGNLALDQVIERDGSILRVLQAHHWFHTNGRCLGRVAPASVVSGLEPCGTLLLAHFIQLFPGAIAIICIT